MESYKIEKLSFRYPNTENKTLDNISFSVNQGEFVTLCGRSGCGKTTLLRLLKTAIAPYGETEGNIFFNGRLLGEYGVREQASGIGFVMQSPDNQIVTDKVWHEIAFGLESLGVSTNEIRTRVSEMASFFGIQTWFYKNVTELSGGQKQLLNLASVMVMQPSVLILDEPTSQLDPIAAQEFLKTVEKINRELGTTVILTEHRLEEAFPMSDRVIVMDKGKIIADASPKTVGAILKNSNHEMYKALPTPMRICAEAEDGKELPMTVREGRQWLEGYAESNTLMPERIPDILDLDDKEKIIEIKDVWFRYKKDLPDVIKGLNMDIRKGELFAIVGGNGTGKSTALSLISGINLPYRGKILVNGVDIKKSDNLCGKNIGVLPQNPQSVFVKKTVYLDLCDILSYRKMSEEETEKRITEIASLCRIENLLKSHPYDISGGEQQRAALAKVLLLNPDILLLDEPTKGMDAHFKEEFADILADLKASGVTVIMVSHDVEFCAEYADRCAMFFDGSVTSCDLPRRFFAGNSFYTTAANRIARGCIPKAIVADDIILACGKDVTKREKRKINIDLPKKDDIDIKTKEKKKLTTGRKILGSVFVFVYLLTAFLFFGVAGNKIFDSDMLRTSGMMYFVMITEVAGAFLCFFPQRELGIKVIEQPKSDRKLTKRTLFAAFLILITIPLTIYIGTYFLGDRKYYFISLLIILETMLPFGMVFESRKPKARELVIISVLCAIAVAGRAAFFMIPEFKPVVAVVIISGVCFGGETGFLVGAVTGFVSNFFFGQGPWTPWQMFAFGIIGFLAGILFKKGFLRKTKASLCVFGFVVTLIIYGGIMNPSSVIQSQSNINMKMIAAAYVSGLPFDLIHSASTVFFLWCIAEPMTEKLERVKIKYGLIER